MSETLVTIESFTTEVDAEIAKGKLEASDIPAYLFKDDCGGMRPHMQLTRGIALKVNEHDAPKALEILHADEMPSVYEEMTDISGGQGDISEDSTLKIYALLRKAKGWVLIGFALLPGWISHPLAFKYSTDALKLYRDAEICDVSLKSRIQRIQICTGVLSVLYWGATILYILHSIRL
jgi:hypothetical protein